MRYVMAGSEGSEYCKYSCKDRTTTASFDSTTYSEAVAYATQACRAGAFNLICVE
ncbi:MAG: hypothetical protein ABIP68_02010 [Ferruginibacter sp.]